MKIWTKTAAMALLFALAAAACTSEAEPAPDGSTTSGGGGGTVVIYSGREEEMVADLIAKMEADTGLDLDVRYGDSAELAAQILEEGPNSPADVFWAQDAGSLGVVSGAGQFAPLDQVVLDRVDPRFRSSDGTWVGVSGRGRVAIYNTDELQASDLPDTVWGLTQSKWKGKLGIAPTNSSFQAFIAAMIEREGEERTREFLEKLKANDPKFYEDNGSTTRAVAAGEVLVGLVNHYYKYEVEAEDGPISAENHFFKAGDPGALINTAGVGVLTTAANPEGAARIVDYLTGEPGQTWVAEDTWEYPLAPGYEPSVDLVPLDQVQGPDIDLSKLGDTLQPALVLLAETGYV
ncbi:MAG: iron ABC transporter substrate-binding protein [Actinomycetota bacterium]